MRVVTMKESEQKPDYGRSRNGWKGKVEAGGREGHSLEGLCSEGERSAAVTEPKAGSLKVSGDQR